MRWGGKCARMRTVLHQAPDTECTMMQAILRKGTPGVAYHVGPCVWGSECTGMRGLQVAGEVLH